MKSYLTRTTIRPWLTAVAVMIVAAYGGVSAQAQSSGDFIRLSGSHLRSEKNRKDSFDPLRWGKRPKPHRSDGSRLSPRSNAKSTAAQNKRTTSKKKAGPATASVANVPLPPPRPPFWPEPRSFAEAAGPGFDTTSITSALSDCDQRLTEIAAIELLPKLIGPGECGNADMIRLHAVLLPNHKRVEVTPTAVLRCAMAESFAGWVRDEASHRVAAQGDALHSVDTYGSYECRSRNGAAGAKLSEHGKGNAIDVRALVLTDGRHITLTDETASKPLRDDLRDSACHRFETVLGPGADSHHNNHIHLDSLERNNGARLCQWDVREPPPPPAKIARGRVRLAARSTLPQPRPRELQTVTAGPWTIQPVYKASKLKSCTMSRSDSDPGISFVRAQDGLSLILESKKWKLDRGKSYPVHLTAGSRSLNTNATAMAETNSVNITLGDTKLNSKLRSANNLQLYVKSTMLRVPLHSSSIAFERLEECFNTGEAPERNALKRKLSERKWSAPSGRKR